MIPFHSLTGCMVDARGRGGINCLAAYSREMRLDTLGSDDSEHRLEAESNADIKSLTLQSELNFT